MKVSYLGIALLLLGLVVIGSAYAGHPLSVVSTPSLNYSGSANVTAVFSTNQASNGNVNTISTQISPPTESNPWLFGQLYGNTKTPSVPITVEYYGYMPGLSYTYFPYHKIGDYVSGSGISQWASPASGTVDVTITVTNESSGQTTQHTVPISVSVSVSSYTRGLHSSYSMTQTYFATITGSGTFTFYDPYSIFTNSAVYAFSFSSGAGTISYGNTSYTITLNPSHPSQTVYGKFTALPPPPYNSYITNFTAGNFWAGTSLNSMTKIVSWEQTLNLHVSSFPAPLYVVFVFNGSIPSNYISIYYTYGIYNNSTTPIVSGIVNFYGKSTTSVTINGQSYPYAFVSTLNISGPSDIVLQGNYGTGEYSGIPIMEIGGFSDNAPVQPAFSTQQYISFGIGGVLILIGAVWIFKK